MITMPKYPIYIPSKGRADRLLTAKMFALDDVPFRIVVEPSEVKTYASTWGKKRVLSLPEDDRGLVYSRNWIKEHAVINGDERHWQFDDDVRYLVKFHRGMRVCCAANIALATLEDFVDRYENVGLASLNSEFFLPSTSGYTLQEWPPFYLNARCYTNFLMLNSLPNRWRGRYNEDTDMTLQVLSAGWCTILFNAFLIKTNATMTAPGGQMVEMYGGDGRLQMARDLERAWPGVVETRRRFGRPQHVVRDSWRRFDTPLKLKAGVGKVKDRGLTLRAVGKIKSATVRKYLREEGDER